MYRFANIELCTAMREVRLDGRAVDASPRVFQLFLLLAQNPNELLSKERLIEEIWAGRVVSDSALSSVIKDARKLVGDSGSSQKIIRTRHGHGIGIVPVVVEVPDSIAANAQEKNATAVPIEPVSDTASIVDKLDTALVQATRKPSIAILPFEVITPGVADRLSPWADALAADVISALSRLRSMDVTSRASSFRFRSAEADIPAIRKALAVGYCLCGFVETVARTRRVTIELIETEHERTLWVDEFEVASEDVHGLRSDIVAAIVTSLEAQMVRNEASSARLIDPHSLDAWAHYHLGLQAMYSFSVEANVRAKGHFKKSVSLDPQFARAHAGLSFIEFQSAFMNFDKDRDGLIERSRESAQAGVELDPLDPFANYCMGRIGWITGELDDASVWMQRSLEISPSFAQGHYAKALVQSFKGEGQPVRDGAGMAMRLSPLDPLYYGMLGAHVFSFLNEERFSEAVDWADRAATAPGAHAFIRMIAAIAHQLDGRTQSASRWIDRASKQQSGLSAEQFFAAFPFQTGESRSRMQAALKQLGAAGG